MIQHLNPLPLDIHHFYLEIRQVLCDEQFFSFKEWIRLEDNHFKAINPGLTAERNPLTFQEFLRKKYSITRKLF